MANRPKGFGMTAELEKKKAAKFDADLADETLQWIVSILNTGSSEDQELASQIVKVQTEKDVHTPLKDGVILCHLVNNIKPGSVGKVNNSKMAFKQMENIGKFLAGCEGLGMNKTDLFQTVDLYEGGNIPQVVFSIIALGRKAKAMGLQGLGPKESTANKREFTDEQLRAGEGVIGLQAGSNKGASQAGQSFGKSRMILD